MRPEEGLEQERNMGGEEPDTQEEKPEEEIRDESSQAEQAADSGLPEEEAGEAEDPEEAGEEPEGESEDGHVRRGLFGKKKKDKKDIQIEELTDRVKRQLAEFDNFRKRTDREKASMFENGQRSVLEKILPTLDNFERGLASISPEQAEDPMVQGMEKIYRQLLTTMESIGVSPIEAVGKPFDPDFHNAVMHVEDEEAGENIIVEEFQKGYLFHDSVLRHSMVKVAN